MSSRSIAPATKASGFWNPTNMDLVRSPVFASYVEALMEAQHVPGLAIAVLQDKTVASTGYGWASMDPPRPCTADTLFNIASASKSLTAASVGLLVHDNVNYPTVQYNATMSSLLPDDFAMAEEKYTNEVTVEDILGHRSGIPRYILPSSSMTPLTDRHATTQPRLLVSGPQSNSPRRRPVRHAKPPQLGNSIPDPRKVPLLQHDVHGGFVPG